MVPGGGAALVHAGKVLVGLTGANPDQTAGIRIVARAIQAPLRQIAENAGVDGAVVAGKVIESSDPTFGFDAQTEMYGDMFGVRGIIDPAKISATRSRPRPPWVPSSSRLKRWSRCAERQATATPKRAKWPA